MQAVTAAFAQGLFIYRSKQIMHIGDELKELRKEEATTQALTKILALVGVWDCQVAEVMREIIRLYDQMIIKPNDGHDISYYTGERMMDAFKILIEEIIKEEEPYSDED
ncbi:MAG: hypothetical protein ACOX8T_10890 [Bacillota bacterium]